MFLSPRFHALTMWNFYQISQGLTLEVHTLILVPVGICGNIVCSCQFVIYKSHGIGYILDTYMYMSIYLCFIILVL